MTEMEERVARAIWNSRFCQPANWSWEGADATRPLSKRFCVEAARAAIEAMPKAEWRPIETAPKDGTSFLAWFVGEQSYDHCHWQKAEYEGYPEGWRDGFITVYPEGDPSGPSHWMIPAPPSE